MDFIWTKLLFEVLLPLQLISLVFYNLLLTSNVVHHQLMGAKIHLILVARKLMGAKLALSKDV